MTYLSTISQVLAVLALVLELCTVFFAPKVQIPQWLIIVLICLSILAMSNAR